MSSDHRQRRTPLQLLEKLTLVHVGVFVVTATWGFGGEAEWLRPSLVAWGWLGAFITLAVILRPKLGNADTRGTLWWAAPIVLFNVVVLVAALNPSLTLMRHDDGTILVPFGGAPGRPSSAMPELARAALLEFDALWISAFNIALVFGRRRVIRTLLLLCAVNALALAIFGTAQKLSQAPGLYFGAIASPQKYFFASFVYHNHWGAFALLMVAVCLGLGAHYARRHAGRDALHSPFIMALVVVLIIAATIPLSASRSSTILVTVLLGGTFVQYVLKLVRKRQHYNESIFPPLLGAGAAATVALAGIWYVAGPTIKARLDLTERQVTKARQATKTDARVLLYQDTLRMAEAKPWFGWGMASYPHVFTLYNRRTSPQDRLPVFYEDAHSDWLQALAEHGIVGTLLLACAALLPLISAWRRYPGNSITSYLLGGCALVVFYALLEFPFGNFSVVLCWWLCLFSAVQYARLKDIPSVSPAEPEPGVRPS